MANMSELACTVCPQNVGSAPARTEGLILPILPTFRPTFHAPRAEISGSLSMGRGPVYGQIGEQVRNGVARGWLAPHDQLPSSRELARTLVINERSFAAAAGRNVQKLLAPRCWGSSFFR